MKKPYRQRMKSRRDRFVIGYIGAKNIVFGVANDPRKEEYQFKDACEPLTRVQAARKLAQMPSGDCAIFELVPVQINQ